MKEITKSLLLELADFLDELPVNRFRFDQWVGPGWRGDPDLSCGTTACAAGWATTLPSFRARGLHMSYDRLPASGPFRGTEAMAEVLGISDDEALALFIPGEYDRVLDMTSPHPEATPKDVAAYIRSWVAAKSKHDEKSS